jgi:glucose dehydrogenase
MQIQSLIPISQAGLTIPGGGDGWRSKPLFEISNKFSYLLFSIILFALIISIPQGAAWAQSAAGAEWTTPAGTLQGTRFSSLNQIDNSNVAQLQEEFHFSTGVLAGHE